MRRLLVVALLVLAPSLAFAQQAPPSKSALVTYYAGNPFGGCSGFNRLWWNTTTDILWFCEDGTWVSTLTGAAAGFPLTSISGDTTVELIGIASSRIASLYSYDVSDGASASVGINGTVANLGTLSAAFIGTKVASHSVSIAGGNPVVTTIVGDGTTTITATASSASKLGSFIVADATTGAGWNAGAGAGLGASLFAFSATHEMSVGITSENITNTVEALGGGGISTDVHASFGFQRQTSESGNILTVGEATGGQSAIYGHGSEAATRFNFGSSKSLPDNTLTGFVQVALPSSGDSVGSAFYAGGTLNYYYRSTGGSNGQAEYGIVTWASAYVGAGTDHCDIDKVSSSQVVSTGTLTVTFACSVSGSGTVTLEATADTSFNNTGALIFVGETLAYGSAIAPIYP